MATQEELVREAAALGRDASPEAKRAMRSAIAETALTMVDRGRTSGDRLKCFLLGVEVGDALEDLQEQTEDLIEQAAVVSDPFQTISLPSCLVNTAGDLVDMLVGPASLDCGWESPGIGVLNQLRGGRVKPAEVEGIRREVDKLTAHFARTANETGLGR